MSAARPLRRRSPLGGQRAARRGRHERRPAAPKALAPPWGDSAKREGGDMSAAKWRRAMSAPVVVGGGASALASRGAAPPLPRPSDTPGLGELLRAHVRPRHLI